MKASECLVVEDAPAGIEAGHAGGMKIIGITSTYPSSALEADVVIKALSQIRVKKTDRAPGLTVDVELT